MATVTKGSRVIFSIDDIITLGIVDEVSIRPYRWVDAYGKSITENEEMVYVNFCYPDGKPMDFARWVLLSHVVEASDMIDILEKLPRVD